MVVGSLRVQQRLLDDEATAVVSSERKVSLSSCLYDAMGSARRDRLFFTPSLPDLNISMHVDQWFGFDEGFEEIVGNVPMRRADVFDLLQVLLLHQPSNERMAPEENNFQVEVTFGQEWTEERFYSHPQRRGKT